MDSFLSRLITIPGMKNLVGRDASGIRILGKGEMQGAGPQNLL